MGRLVRRFSSFCPREEDEAGRSQQGKKRWRVLEAQLAEWPRLHYERGWTFCACRGCELQILHTSDSCVSSYIMAIEAGACGWRGYSWPGDLPFSKWKFTPIALKLKHPRFSSGLSWFKVIFVYQPGVTSILLFELSSYLVKKIWFLVYT